MLSAGSGSVFSNESSPESRRCRTSILSSSIRSKRSVIFMMGGRVFCMLSEVGLIQKVVDDPEPVFQLG